MRSIGSARPLAWSDKQPLDARAKRRQRAGEHAGVGAPEQLVQREQRGQFLAGQPQAGQLEALGFVRRVAERGSSPSPLSIGAPSASRRNAMSRYNVAREQPSSSFRRASGTG